MLLLLRVGEIVHGAGSEDIFLGNDESGEAVGELVEPAAYSCVPHLKYALAEAFVVTLSPFEGAVDEDFESWWFRRCLLEFPGQSFEVWGDEVGFDIPGIELRVGAASNPGRLEAGGLGPDDVEGVAGDEPGLFRRSP